MSMRACMSDWAVAEFGAAELGDQRLNRRLVRLAALLGAAPAASLPEACRGAAETKAAYRFFAQEDCDWRALLGPHWACTQQRMGAEARVLCVQDTTELDFTTQPGVAGLGRLGHDARHGLYVHPTLAVTPAGVALGVLDAWMWARAARGQASVLESRRWLEGYERVAELAASLPGTRLVYVADRESDIRALMDRAAQLGTPADWLVRAAHNRALADGAKLWAQLAQAPALAEVSFELPAAAGRAARTVMQEVRCVRVSLPDRGQGECQVTAIEARERDAPPGCKAVLWRLLTNEVIENLEAACERIDWYRQRWWVEVFFRILKSGCRARGVATVERRAPGAGAGGVSGRRLAGAADEHARARSGAGVLRVPVQHRGMAGRLDRAPPPRPATQGAEPRGDGALGGRLRRLSRAQVRRRTRAESLVGRTQLSRRLRRGHLLRPGGGDGTVSCGQSVVSGAADSVTVRH